MRTQADFVRAVMEATRLTPTQLGDALKLRNPYQKVHGWETGKGQLGYENTIKMLELAGWLAMPAEGDDLSDDSAFNRALLGRVVMLLEQEEEMRRQHPGLLLALAENFRSLAGRLEALAEARSDGGRLPS